MRAPFIDFLAAAAPAERDERSVTLKVNMRQAIMALPSPRNIERIPALIPDVAATLILSTASELPYRVQDHLAASKRQEFLTATTLLGLSMGGRGMPVDIFLHMHKMMDDEPTGRLAETIFWHETLHAMEGVSADGASRATPWSYELQERMRQCDLDSGGGMKLAEMFPEDSREQEFVRYLRQGDKAQQNVSEIFARVGVLALKHLRKTGEWAQSANDFISERKLMDEYNSDAPFERTDTQDAHELVLALATYGNEARGLFWGSIDKMAASIGQLYGCPTP